MILQEGVAFLSHQWASFEHPDPDGVQYRTSLTLLKAFSRSSGVIQGLYRDYIGIMEKNMETAIVYWGLHRDNRKEK